MRQLKRYCATLLIGLCAGHASAADRDTGDFDYYVLALSWSPTWCDLEGDARQSPQCDPRHDFGFVLHGLWPQYETGWPANCRTSTRDPSRQDTAAMADIMGTSGAAWYQWKKHGRCSGLAASDYFEAARDAYASVERPEILRRVTETLNVAPKVIEAAFLESNPDLEADGVTVTCKSGMIQEVRICLTRDLEPRTCGSDVIRDCTARTGTLPPIR